MTSFELASLILSATSVIILLTGLIYAGRQINLMKATLRDEHDLKRRIAAQEAINSLSDRVNYRQILEQYFNYVSIGKPVLLEKINEVMKSEPNIKVLLADFLNYYEMLARGVAQGIYDEEVITDARKSPMIDTFDAFHFYIEELRKESPLVFCRMEALVNKWKHEMTNGNDRPKTGI